ncbi:MAG: GCN5-related N-acetyltransferase [Akkermansiaceae bacterium]|nr:GCN5-related N-acetyltransferase [Akkermansiaceae bacterium]
MDIIPADQSHAESIWRIFSAVVANGDTYVFDPAIGREDALAYWLAAGTHAFVAVDAGEVLGTYILKANQPGLGSHVANAGYMVSGAARGRGVGSAMCEHSLAMARDLGFAAMQFNIVVSTNGVAVKLWQKHGFQIVGTLPKVFRHQTLGLVDAFVMHRFL